MLHTDHCIPFQKLYLDHQVHSTLNNSVYSPLLATFVCWHTRTSASLSRTQRCHVFCYVMRLLLTLYKSQERCKRMHHSYPNASSTHTLHTGNRTRKLPQSKPMHLSRHNDRPFLIIQIILLSVLHHVILF